MTQRYIFFNSALGDLRTYQASDFAEYFGSVLSTGLLHTDNVPGMSVSVETGTLNTVISAGKAIMKGHFYDNTATTTLTHAIPEASLDRIDRIVLRLDLRNSERNILLKVLTGVASSTPLAPVLQRDNFIYEISLAQILVRANTVQLLQSDLIDERLDESLCGLVYSLISIPTSQFQAEWDAWFDTNTPIYQAEWQNFIDTLAGQSPVMSVNGVTPDVNGNVDAGGSNAEEISVLDVAEHFTGTNVETVLDELFTFANDGKTAVADAVTAKGVTASPTDTFSALATKIGQITTGKKWASGDITGTQTFITVTGLTFSPSHIVIQQSQYIDSSLSNMSVYTQVSPTRYVKTSTTSGIVVVLDGTNNYVINGSFRLQAPGNYTSYKWWAFE